MYYAHFNIEMGYFGPWRCTLAEFLLSAEDTSGDTLKQHTLPMFIPVYKTLLEALVTRAQVRGVSVHAYEVSDGASSPSAFIDSKEGELVKLLFFRDLIFLCTLNSSVNVAASDGVNNLDHGI